MAASRIDAYVGRRIGTARKKKYLSRPALASKVGISGEQLRKYEVGMDRITAGRLYDIAKALEKPIDWFYLGLAKTAVVPQVTPEPQEARFPDPHAPTRRLMSVFRQLPEHSQQEVLMELEGRLGQRALAS